MNLRKKTLLFLAATLFGTAAVISLIANTIFLDSQRQLEKQDISADVIRFHRALEFEMNRLNGLTYDWAAWDDTYLFMQGNLPDYIPSNLSQDTLQNLELNFMVFLGTDQTVFYAVTAPIENSDNVISMELWEHLSMAYLETLAPADEYASNVGLVQINSLPVMISSRPILTSAAKGPPLGRLLFGQVITGRLLEHLQNITGEEISFQTIDPNQWAAGQLDDQALLPAEEAILTAIKGNDIISATAPIGDIRGHPIFLITVEKPREIFQQGRASMLRLGFSLVLASSLGVAMALLFLEKGVISKLSRLNSSVSEIRCQGYSGQPLNIEGDDEISSLAQEMENAFKELTLAHADVNHHLDFQRALVRLSTSFINLPITKIDNQIQNALKTIGEMAEADRSYVFLRRENEPHIFDNSHEWCRRGIQPAKSMLQGISESALPWWFMRMKRGDTILIPSVADMPDEAAPERELLLAQSIHSLVVVPLQASGQLIGSLGFDAVKKKGGFTERDVALLGIVGNMIANAVDRQHKEERLTNSHQIQFQLNKITRASIEKNSLRSTAITLSRELNELIHSDRGILILFDDEGNQQVFDSGHMVRTSLIDTQAILEFLQSQKEYIYLHEGINQEDAPTFIQHLGLAACVVIPLVSEQEILGAAILADNQTRVYTQEEAAICQQAGPQLTLAILKVKALEAAHRRTQELDALRVTIADITSELEPNKLLRTMLERAVCLAHADGGEICVFDEESQKLIVVASHNLDKDYSGTWMAVGEGAGGQAVKLRKTFMVRDYATWPGRMRPYVDIPFHATIVIPLMIGDRVLGTIAILHFKPDRQFSKDDQYILSLFAHHASIAMENAMLFEKVQGLARTDAVTGLLNRRALREIGDYEVERANRLNQPLAIAMIDLDDFKVVNDRYSHRVGDDVLREVARLCRENIRNIDIISRYGGDEFIIIMPATDQDSAVRVSQRLQDTLASRPIKVNGDTFIPRFSMGLTVHHTNPPPLDEMLAQADEALYKAKNRGKNQICLYKVGKE